jgi:hypothetical protein
MARKGPDMAEYKYEDELDAGDFITAEERDSFNEWRRQTGRAEKVKRPVQIDYENSEDPRKAAERIIRETEDAGATREDAFVAGLNHLFVAAKAGDKRVRLDLADGDDE